MVHSNFLHCADVFGRNRFFKFPSEFIWKLCLSLAILFWVEMSDLTQMFWNPGSGRQGADCQCVLAICLPGFAHVAVCWRQALARRGGWGVVLEGIAARGPSTALRVRSRFLGPETTPQEVNN